MMTMAMKILPQMFYTDFLGIYAGVSRHIAIDQLLLDIVPFFYVLWQEMEIYNIMANYYEVIVILSHLHATR